MPGRLIPDVNWMGPSAALNAVPKRETSASAGNWTLVTQLVASLYYWITILMNFTFLKYPQT